MRNLTQTSGFLMGAVLMVLAGSVSWAPVAAQEVYKTVDENGNVVYTDQKPSDDAVPVELKELTVVDALELGDDEAISSQPGDDENANGPPNRGLGLTIASPQPEETINNTAYVLSVQVQMDRELPQGARLAYIVDGEEQVTTRSTSAEIEQVFRGEHQLRVEARSSSGRVLDSAGPVTFFMRQHSIQHPPPG